VRQVMTEAQEPMRMCEIITGVEAMLGKPVTKSSVENCLCSNITGEHPRFVRWGGDGIESYCDALLHRVRIPIIGESGTTCEPGCGPGARA
jgi:hypothetical protein